jgi:hypothetical protein
VREKHAFLPVVAYMVTWQACCLCPRSLDPALHDEWLGFLGLDPDFMSHQRLAADLSKAGGLHVVVVVTATCQTAWYWKL